MSDIVVDSEVAKEEVAVVEELVAQVKVLVIILAMVMEEEEALAIPGLMVLVMQVILPNIINFTIVNYH